MPGEFAGFDCSGDLPQGECGTRITSTAYLSRRGTAEGFTSRQVNIAVEVVADLRPASGDNYD